MELSTILFGGVVFLLAVLYRHLTKNRGQLEALGIPVDKGVFLLGSPPYGIHNYNMHEVYLENFKKYGKTFGRYVGIQPVVSTIDPEILKSVLVKNFDSFTNIVDMHIEEEKMTLDIASGQTWRSLRKVLSPTFTSGKMKSMLEPMEEVANATINHVDKLVEKNPVIDVKDVFQGLAINTIARCAFGIDANYYQNPDQELVKAGREIFQAFRSTSWFESIFLQIIFYFPGLERLLPLLPASYDVVTRITKDIIKQRKDLKMEGNDFIARLIELRRLKEANPDDEFLKHIKFENIDCQAITFFAAGYETTANTLSTLCYNLAKNPDVQQNIVDEITTVLEDHDGRIDHETITEMHYLEAAIKENLRVYSPAAIHLRTCSKDCEVIPGLVIKKGMRVDMPINPSHQNPEFFPEPEQFRPERFLKENASQIIPYTWRPFGGGPRECIGQRFAMVEMKIVTAKLLSKYRILKAPETKLEIRKGEEFMLSYEDLKLKLEKRE